MLPSAHCPSHSNPHFLVRFLRGFLAPAARWPVGLSAARWTAATPFLKQAGHAHGNEADLARDSLTTLASPRHASELWQTAVQKLHASSPSPPTLHTLRLPLAGGRRARSVVFTTACSGMAAVARKAPIANGEGVVRVAEREAARHRVADSRVHTV